MSFDHKPPIFAELDEAQFARLPPNYRLMETGSALEMQVAYCDPYRCTLALYPFHRPITKTFGKINKEGEP